MANKKEEVKFGEEELQEQMEEEDKPVKYRYFCDACTNTAFFGSEPKEGLKGVCQACGKPYVTRKENYIRI